MRVVFRAALLWALMSGAVQAQSAEPDAPADAILILDASGSMWGQIEGVNKIVIAKDVVEGLVRQLPEGQRLGFVAYGHRRKGDCADIETLADVGAAREDVIAQLRALSPRGMTPLTDSVRHAAETLDYERNAARVILVSDGLETCDADPCALARALEENGLDFTVHVVGFDVTEEERAGLQCIAEETGGAFLAADDADGLTAALTEVAALEGQAEPSDAGGAPVPSTLALKATILSGGPLIQSDLAWTVTPAEGGEPVFTASDAGAVETEVLPGAYVAEASWSGWRGGGDDKTGRAEFTVNPQQPKVVTVPIDLGLDVTLEAPDEVAEGHPFEVIWTGPDALGALVSVNRPDDSPRDPIYFVAASEGPTATLGGPSTAGDYEVRYILDSPRLVLARRPLTVTDSAYALEAPAEVAASSAFEVTWSGPLTDGDFITLVEAGSQEVFERGATARLSEGEPATLTAPAEPGEYEVRYVLENDYTLYPGMQRVAQASAPLTVTAVEASLSGPETAVGGSTVSVDWQGPDGWEDDRISAVEPGAEAVNRESFARLEAAGEPAMLRLPATPGEYELAYFLYPGGRALARQPITITQAEASVDAPDTVKAGESFTVRYSGDGFAGDRVVVAPADEPDSKMWSYTVRYGFAAEAGGGEGAVSEYPISAGPGEYEARYVTGMQHQVIARDRFTVVE